MLIQRNNHFLLLSAFSLCRSSLSTRYFLRDRWHYSYPPVQIRCQDTLWNTHTVCQYSHSLHRHIPSQHSHDIPPQQILHPHIYIHLTSLSQRLFLHPWMPIRRLFHFPQMYHQALYLPPSLSMSYPVPPLILAHFPSFHHQLQTYHPPALHLQNLFHPQTLHHSPTAPHHCRICTPSIRNTVYYIWQVYLLCLHVFADHPHHFLSIGTFHYTQNSHYCQILTSDYNLL